MARREHRTDQWERPFEALADDPAAQKGGNITAASADTIMREGMADPILRDQFLGVVRDRRCDGPEEAAMT